MNFFDTNVLLYAASSAAKDEFKRERAVALLERGDVATSGQVHAEFYWNATRKIVPPLSHSETLVWLDRFSRFLVVPVTGELVARGAAFADRYQITYWDGAIIAAAHAAEADMLFSEDLNNGQRYGDVRVVNPFKD